MDSAFVLGGGSLVLAGSVYLLWDSERETVLANAAFEKDYARTTIVSSSEIVDDNDGKIVYVSGDVAAGTAVLDPDFPSLDAVIASTGSVRTRRVAEILQWCEYTTSAQHRHAGRTMEKENYLHVKEWHSKSVDSSSFADTTKTNPPIVVASEDFISKPAFLGAFSLDGELMADLMLEDTEELRIAGDVITGKGIDFVRGNDGWFYSGEVCWGDKNGPVKVTTVSSAHRLFEACNRDPVSKNDAIFIAKKVLGDSNPVVEKLGSDDLTGSAPNGGFTWNDVASVLGWHRIVGEPKVGDHRVRFEVIPGGRYSAWGQQKSGGKLTHYLHGKSISEAMQGIRLHVIARGSVPLEALLSLEESERYWTLVMWTVGLVALEGASLFALSRGAGIDFGPLPNNTLPLVIVPVLTGATIATAWAPYKPQRAAAWFFGGVALSAGIGFWATR